MKLSQKLIKCNYDGEHSFVSSPAGTGLVRHVCQNCHHVSFDSVDFLSTRGMRITTNPTVRELAEKLASTAA